MTISRLFTFLEYWRLLEAIQESAFTEQRVTVNPRLGQTIIDLTQETDIEATATAVPSQQSEERSAEDTSNHDPALGGGSEVRICNPCVPDPNYGPPPQPPPYDFNAGIIPDYRTADEVSNPSSTPATRHLAYYRERDTMPQERHRESTDISTHHGLNVANVSRSERQANGQLTVNGSHEIDTGLPRGPDALTNIHGRYPYHYRAEGQENIKSRESIESHTDDGGGQNSITSSSTASLVPPRSSSMYGASAGPSSSLPSQSHLGQVPPQVRHRHHASQGIARFGFRSMLDVETPIPPPKRQPIREEDLCPICHATLPPKGTEGDETAREQHVQACIETHFSTSAPRSIQPHPNTATAAAVAATSTTQAQAGGLLSSSPTLPGPRGGRMLVYNATEKDCVSDDGEEPECVICLVEFAVGDDMARLECLCKFHKTCIRQWWETKGAGACPVHQG
ncbi:MAG: hypothetical protein M1827_003864 [Pycnora praestabilis]|nr:MAG: hypothetical protein M1827_003864 [Pycnora praestabilis]